MSDTFKLSEAFKESVKKKDNDSILSSFAVLINTDRSFEKGKVYKAIEYIEENYPDFIQPDRFENFKSESEWTEEYWTDISASLYNYFSLEKIKFLENMSKKLYPHKNKQYTNSKYEFEDESNNTNWDDSSKKFNPALAIAIVAGAVIIVTGIIIATMNK